MSFKEFKKFTTNDCMDAGGRATQEQLPRHEGHEVLFLRVLRVFVVNKRLK